MSHTASNQRVMLTKLGVTPMGSQVVSYIIQGKRCSCFLPSELQRASAREVRAWLAERVEGTVLGAHERLSQLRPEGLLRALADVPANSLHQVLVKPKQHIQSLQFGARGSVEALVAGSKKGTHYKVQLDVVSGASSCTCPFGVHRANRTCKHAGMVAALLLGHVDVASSNSGLEGLIRVQDVGKGCASVEVEVLEVTRGFVVVRAAGLTRWLELTQVAFRGLKLEQDKTTAEMIAPADSSVLAELTQALEAHREEKEHSEALAS